MADRRRHRAVLERVRAQLESPPPAEKRVSVKKPATPLRKIEQVWNAGQVVAYQRNSGKFVLLLTEGVFRHSYSGEIPYFVLLNWEGAKLPTAERIRKIRFLDYVIAVWPSRKGQPIPWEKVERLDVTRDLTGLVRIDRVGVFRERGWEECQWRQLDETLADEFDELPLNGRYRQNAHLFD